MRKIEELERRIEDLERNVGVVAADANLDDMLRMSEYNSIHNYAGGAMQIKIFKEAEKKRKEAEAQFPKIVCAVGKRVAFRYYGKPIYYPAEHAVFDLHIPAGTHFVFHGKICISTGTIRSVDERDIRDILCEDNSDFFNKDLVQDMEHPTDLYVIDK